MSVRSELLVITERPARRERERVHILVQECALKKANNVLDIWSTEAGLNEEKSVVCTKQFQSEYGSVEIITTCH